MRKQNVVTVLAPAKLNLALDVGACCPMATMIWT